MELSNEVTISHERLYENLLNIWQKIGHQPRRNDLQNEHSEFSQTPYLRRFKSWTNALEAFIMYMNENDSIDYKKAEGKIHSSRDPTLRLRYKILKRDNFKCCICGRSSGIYQNIVTSY